MFTVVPGSVDSDDPRPEGGAGSAALIDELVREGARRMLAEALAAEVDAYLARFTGERDDNGRRLVVRNGTHQPREVLTSAGAVEVVAPRVNDRRVDPDTGERARFSSAILPPCLTLRRWSDSQDPDAIRSRLSEFDRFRDGRSQLDERRARCQRS